MSEAEELKGVKLVGAIEAIDIDITPYINKQLKIESVQTFKSKYEGKDSYYMVMKTEVVATVETVEVRASRQFGLKFDDKGENPGLGWPETGNLAKFLKFMKVEHPDDLIGETVTTKASDPDDNGKVWLRF